MVCSSCPVCGSADIEERESYRGNHPIFTGLKRAHCGCGMVFASPMPCIAALKAYNESYFASAHGGKPRSSLETAFFSGIARLRLAHIDKYVMGRGIVISNTLEFGPGLGYFSKIWLAKYPNTDYKAFETDSSCHTSLQEMGVNLVEASILEEDTTPFDLILISHVLEHVSNPFDFLKAATRNLRVGGVLFIEVPCRDWEHKAIDEPHLLFFDKGPMEHLLKMTGFYDLEISYYGQEIEWLRLKSPARNAYARLRGKLISLGFVAPFARMRPGMETIIDPLERAVLAPFQAHLEKRKPAWWLRAVARKKSKS